MAPFVRYVVYNEADRGLSVTVVRPAKTAEPIEMPFGCGLEWA